LLVALARRKAYLLTSENYEETRDFAGIAKKYATGVCALLDLAAASCN